MASLKNRHLLPQVVSHSGSSRIAYSRNGTDSAEDEINLLSADEEIVEPVLKAKIRSPEDDEEISLVRKQIKPKKLQDSDEDEVSDKGNLSVDESPEVKSEPPKRKRGRPSNSDRQSVKKQPRLSNGSDDTPRKRGRPIGSKSKTSAIQYKPVLHPESPRSRTQPLLPLAKSKPVFELQNQTLHKFYGSAQKKDATADAFGTTNADASNAIANKPPEDGNAAVTNSKTTPIVKKDNNQYTKQLKTPQSPADIKTPMKGSPMLIKDLIPEIEGDLKPGDLLWSFVPGHPFWPCFVSREPNPDVDKPIYSKTVMHKKFFHTQIYHVLYFGKGAQHGWTIPTGIMNFKGKAQYDEIAASLIKNHYSASKHLLKTRFKVSPTRYDAWLEAVTDAEGFLSIDRKARVKQWEVLCAAKNYLPNNKLAKEADEPDVQLKSKYSPNKEKTLQSKNDEVKVKKLPGKIHVAGNRRLITVVDAVQNEIARTRVTPLKSFFECKQSPVVVDTPKDSIPKFANQYRKTYLTGQVRRQRLSETKATESSTTASIQRRKSTDIDDAQSFTNTIEKDQQESHEITAKNKDISIVTELETPKPKRSLSRKRYTKPSSERENNDANQIPKVVSDLATDIVSIVCETVVDKVARETSVVTEPDLRRSLARNEQGSNENDISTVQEILQLCVPDLKLQESIVPIAQKSKEVAIKPVLRRSLSRKRQGSNDVNEEESKPSTTAIVSDLALVMINDQPEPEPIPVLKSCPENKNESVSTDVVTKPVFRRSLSRTAKNFKLDSNEVIADPIEVIKNIDKNAEMSKSITSGNEPITNQNDSDAKSPKTNSLNKTLYGNTEDKIAVPEPILPNLPVNANSPECPEVLKQQEIAKEELEKGKLSMDIQNKPLKRLKKTVARKISATVIEVIITDENGLETKEFITNIDQGKSLTNGVECEKITGKCSELSTSQKVLGEGNETENILKKSSELMQSLNSLKLPVKENPTYLDGKKFTKTDSVENSVQSDIELSKEDHAKLQLERRLTAEKGSPTKTKVTRRVDIRSGVETEAEPAQKIYDLMEMSEPLPIVNKEGDSILGKDAEPVGKSMCGTEVKATRTTRSADKTSASKVEDEDVNIATKIKMSISQANELEPAEDEITTSVSNNLPKIKQTSFVKPDLKYLLSKRKVDSNISTTTKSDDKAEAKEKASTTPKVKTPHIQKGSSKPIKDKIPPETEASKSATPKADTSKIVDTPKTATLKVDDPQTGTPKGDTPKSATLKVDTPKAAVPKVDNTITTASRGVKRPARVDEPPVKRSRASKRTLTHHKSIDEQLAEIKYDYVEEDDDDVIKRHNFPKSGRARVLALPGKSKSSSAKNETSRISTRYQPSRGPTSPESPVGFESPELEAQRDHDFDMALASGPSSDSDMRSVKSPETIMTEDGKSSECPDTDQETVDSTETESESVTVSTRHERVCQLCEVSGDVVVCKGPCQQYFHLGCMGITDLTPDQVIKCYDCSVGRHSCFACNSKEGTIRKCSISACGKFYHDECMKNCSVGLVTETRLVCSLHTCLSCFNDDANGCRNQKGRLVRCVRCPTAYHSNEDCIAAGSVQLSNTHILCASHFQPKKGNTYHTQLNTPWCMLCSEGGQLICCERCPGSFHAECLDIVPPEEGYFCTECKARSHPRYGEIVWVKLGCYRWWPAKIIPPSLTPANIQRLEHTVGEFPVQFFGSHDYFWIHKGRVFSFQDGDKGGNGSSRHLARLFQVAIEEATVANREWREERKARVESLSVNNKPPPYRHIRVNKPVGKVQTFSSDQSQTNPCECNPNAEDPCGYDSECINRMLHFECHAGVCPAGDKCNNMLFQKRIYPACAVKKVEGRGWGLFAQQDIKKGTFVSEYVGELIDDEECERRLKAMYQENNTNFYFLTIERDRIIDAGPKGNFSRFMNHSCQPNCETQKWLVNCETRVGLFAVDDITLGSELTFNYNLECRGNEKTKCSCGSQNCSGFIGVRPKTTFALGQEKKVKDGVGKKKKKKVEVRKHDDFCYRCGEGGELLMCDKAGCTKSYHLSCLQLSKPPKGKWECPWHHCDVCGKPSTTLCEDCPNSFCKSHGTTENITERENGQWICYEHGEPIKDLNDGETL